MPTRYLVPTSMPKHVRLHLTLALALHPCLLPGVSQAPAPIWRRVLLPRLGIVPLHGGYRDESCAQGAGARVARPQLYSGGKGGIHPPPSTLLKAHFSVTSQGTLLKAHFSRHTSQSLLPTLLIKARCVKSESDGLVMVLALPSVSP